uniref:Uncharacterized protein n=1 Tax=Oryza nivara TaxID=4536 RepID=A0A0E0GXU6_ORYNI
MSLASSQSYNYAKNTPDVSITRMRLAKTHANQFKRREVQEALRTISTKSKSPPIHLECDDQSYGAASTAFHAKNPSLA